jgi:hypothetical protein
MCDGDSIETGRDLYDNLLLIDNISNVEELSLAYRATGFIGKFTQGVYLVQDTCNDMILPTNISENELIEISKLMNYKHLDLPDKGVEVDQAIRIYQKWAEDNPEKLRNTAMKCLFMSYVEAYGLEIPAKRTLQTRE